jgi:hypothetical protein
LSSIPAILSTTQLLTSSIQASTMSARFISAGSISVSSSIYYDALNNNSANVVYVASTFLYFNSYVIGGSKVAQPQWVTF